MTAGSPVLRGSLRKTNRMELFQEGYLRAVAAAAGCTVAEPRPDDGIDVMLSHENVAHTTFDDHVVDLKIQMKSTGAVSPNPASGFVDVKVRNKRFNAYAALNVGVPRIVVAMIVPPDFDQWLISGHQNLMLHHSAYWVSLRGEPLRADDDGEGVVKVPTTQIFDDVSLCGMMARIGGGGWP